MKELNEVILLNNKLGLIELRLKKEKTVMLPRFKELLVLLPRQREDQRCTFTKIKRGIYT